MKESTQMIFDPRTGEAQLFSQFIEDLIEAGTILVFTLYDEG